MSPLVIGIAGGTGSGKTTLCQAIIDQFGSDLVAHIPCDSYYKDLSHIAFEERASVNFDHPSAYDFSLLASHMERSVSGEAIEIPVFDFVARQRSGRYVTVEPKPVILIDGILILAEESLCTLIDVKVFLDEESDIRLIRRLVRDTSERGRTMESVIQQYLESVRPMHKKLVEPSKQHADLIGASDQNTLTRISRIIREFLEEIL